jgi:nitrous oxidase accessory protein NosD
VLVAAGTYYERIDFSGKAIAIVSEAGPELTVIDGSLGGTVVTFQPTTLSGAVLSGFTIRDGLSSSRGSGIHIEGASPTITNNIIEDNNGCSGVGINVYHGSPSIEANIIRRNRQTTCTGGSGGGGILVGGYGQARVVFNVIEGNTVDTYGGGISLNAAGTPLVQGNDLHGNSAAISGGGINLSNVSDALIVQNLIVGNSAADGGGIKWLVPSLGRGPHVVNNTVYGNTATRGTAIFADGGDSETLVVNKILGWARGGRPSTGRRPEPEIPVFRHNDVYIPVALATGAPATMSPAEEFPQTALRRAACGRLPSDPPVAGSGRGDNGARPSEVDFDGEARIQDGDGEGQATVDMGFDEYTPVLGTPTLPTRTPTPTLTPTRVTPATLHVPQEFPSIQVAIRASIAGDTILVAPGTYHEHLDFLGKSIAIVSEAGPVETILDGDWSGTVVIFHTAEDSLARLIGFTLRHGSSTLNAGGINIDGASPQIVGNIIEDNRGCTGIGIRVHDGSPLIQGNIIRGNRPGSCGGSGGGILLGGAGEAQVLDNTIVDNHTGSYGGGIALNAAGTPLIQGNVIQGNTASSKGGGISLVNISDAVIAQNLIASNSSGDGAAFTGGAILGGSVSVNNTIAVEFRRRGSAAFADGFDAEALRQQYGAGRRRWRRCTALLPTTRTCPIHPMTSTADGLSAGGQRPDGDHRNCRLIFRKILHG